MRSVPQAGTFTIGVHSAGRMRIRESNSSKFPLKHLAFSVVAFLVATLPPLVRGADVTVPILEVTASHLPDAFADGTTSSTRIERAEIERRQPQTSLDLLRPVPGVDVTQQGGEGGLTFVSVRGGDPNFTLVLVDGVRMNDPTNSRGGAFDLSMLDPEMIERIEIYPGSLSTVHGSDALSGVISITTRQAPERGAATVTMLAGTRGGRTVAVSGGGKLADNNLSSFFGSFRQGDSAVEGDSLERRNLTARTQFVPGEDLAVGLQLLASAGDATSFPEDSGGPRLAALRSVEKRHFEREVLSVDLDVDISRSLSARGSAGWTRNDEDIDNPGIAPGVLQGIPPVRSRQRYDYMNAYGSASYRASEIFSLTAGASLSRERGRSDDVIDLGFFLPTSFDLTRDTLGIFAEAALTPVHGLLLQGGVRHDNPDSSDSFTVKRFGAAYRLETTDTRLHIHWAEGFKLPSFFALGNPLVGNPNLAPERSRSVEGGARQSLMGGKIGVDLVLFHSRYSNLVDFDPLLFKTVNRRLVESEGFEFRSQFHPTERLTFSLNGTYNDLDVVGASEGLRRRPRWKGGASVDWLPTGSSSIRLDAIYTGEFLDSSIPTGLIEMPGYRRIDMTLRWRFSSAWDAIVSVHNVLNDDFEETVGFPNGGRRIDLGVRLSI